MADQVCFNGLTAIGHLSKYLRGAVGCVEIPVTEAATASGDPFSRASGASSEWLYRLLPGQRMAGWIYPSTGTWALQLLPWHLGPSCCQQPVCVHQHSHPGSPAKLPRKLHKQAGWGSSEQPRAARARPQASGRTPAARLEASSQRRIGSGRAQRLRSSARMPRWRVSDRATSRSPLRNE